MPAASVTSLEIPSRAKGTIRVLIAESSVIQSQLLAHALKSRHGFRVSSVALDPEAIRAHLASNPVNVVLFAAGHAPDFGLLRAIHVGYPGIATVVLTDRSEPDLIVSAFRSGAKGVFFFDHAPLTALCKCITCVSRGQVWINTEQMHFLLDALTQVPALRVVNLKGKSLLTAREEQVVALVADGLSNREAAAELGLSEHTVKKYLFRIFDKLGISTRVELVLYAMANGENRMAEWLPSNS